MRWWVLAGWAAAGCGGADPVEEPAPEGTISLSWTIGSLGCAEAGIASVAVLLDEEERASFPCSAGSGIVPDVAAGGTVVAVRGRDSGGLDRYGADVGSVSVASGADTALGNVTLSALPATIGVFWMFDNGMLCAQNNAESIHVRLFDANDSLGHEGTAACDEGTLILDDVAAGEWTVDLEAISAVDETTWAGEQAIALERGSRADVTVTLSPAP